ncbi:MAG: hypothetical protein NXI16_11875 [Alphaproteobacteria bacterium]|nr:hypothetical protein [Alphaproteobacteria bacterium]
MTLDIDKGMTAVTDSEAKTELTRLLNVLTAPAFGALPKREVDLAVFETLRNLGLIKADASLYELMSALRITRAKANNLLFELEIRSATGTPDQLDGMVVERLAKARFAKDGDYFVLEIENPLVRAHLREKVRKLNHLTDTSFNTSLTRMSLDAVTDLVDALLPDTAKENARKALEKAGAPEPTNFKTVMRSALKTLAGKAVGKAADGLVDGAFDEAGKFLEPILKDAGTGITKVWKDVWTG